MALPPAIRFSKTSTPPGTTLNVDDRIVIAQPTNGTEATGYRTVRITPDELTAYFKNTLTTEGIGAYLTLGGGLVGTGTTTDPIHVDEDWTDTYGVRYDKFALSVVGNSSLPELPISGSYYSINYPYNNEEQAATAYIENNGTLAIISPVTNGQSIRYTYSRVERFTSGKLTATPSDTVYKPAGLTDDEYISSVGNASDTAMFVEITTISTGAKRHGVVILNGTLSYNQHQLVRLEPIVGAFDYTVRGLQDRPPAVFVNKGKIYIVFAHSQAVQLGIQLYFYTVDPTTGTLYQVTNWRLDSRFLTQSSGDFVQLTNGFVSTTDVPGYEVYTLDRTWIGGDYNGSANNNGNTRSLTFHVAQDEQGNVRLAIHRINNMTYSDPGGAGSIVHFYRFSTCFDIYFGPLNQMIERPATRNMKHTANPTLFAADGGENWGGGYRAEPWGYASSAGQACVFTLLSNGGMFLSSTSTASNTTHHNAVMPALKSTTAYDVLRDLDTAYYVDKSISLSATKLWTLLPAITPVIPRTLCHYMATSGAAHSSADRGSCLMIKSSTATDPANHVALAKIKGNATASFTLIDVGTKGGYPLNNDRKIVPSLPTSRGGPISFRKVDGTIYHGLGQFTSAHTNNETEYAVWDMLPDLTVRKYIKLAANVNNSIISQIQNRFTAGDANEWKWAVMPIPGAPTNLALVTVAYSNNPVGNGWIVNGIASFNTTTVDATHFEISSIDITNAKFSNNITGATTIKTWNISPVNMSYAVQQTSATLWDIVIKNGYSGINTGNQSGVLSGCYYSQYDSSAGTFTYINNRTASDGLATAIFPCIGPENMGIGTIDSTVGLGTYYLYKPIYTTGLTQQQIDGYIMLSPTPSQTFTVNIGGDIPVQLNGVRGAIPAQSIDLSTLGLGSPANKTFLFYAIIGVDGIELKITTKALIERLDQTLIAVVITGDEVVESIVATPFSRFGTYRLSEYARGSAAPGTAGMAHAEPPSFWIKNQY